MDSFFFLVSKWAWLVISPDSFIVFLLVMAFVLMLFQASSRLFKLGRLFFTVAMLLVLFITFVPSGEWLLYPLEARFKNNPELPEKVDGIVVLSGAESGYHSHIWQQIQVNGAAERLLKFMELTRKYPDAKHLFTGGSGNIGLEKDSSAEVARELFTTQGLDTSEILFEGAARNTYENAKLSKVMVQPQPGEVWVLITTSWHMPRSVGIFRQLDWKVIPYPVDYYSRKGDLFRFQYGFGKNLSLLAIGMKEWVGLIAYRLTGKTNELFPAAS